jgi:hypothetical protein
MCPRVPVDFSPCAKITLADIHGRAQKPHFGKKRNKEKPCCSLRRERGAEGCCFSHVACVLYSIFPAAAWSLSRWASYLLSPRLKCTLFCSRAVSFSFSVSMTYLTELRKSLIFFLSLSFFFGSIGVWTQGLHPELLHQPFFLWRVFLR